jgi:peptidoglycan/xylan/chitin deacetylase (PgdA/CDA1 family)
VALTFDDGPDPEWTPALLDLLGRNNAKATFFTVGQSVEKYPDLVRQMAEAGHALGSHSWDHSAFPLLSRRERRRHLQACEAALGSYGKGLFRPPYGEQDLTSRFDAWSLGYEVVGWSVTSEDWFEPEAAMIAQYLVTRIRCGDIVLLHDAIFDQGKPIRGPKPDRVPWVDRRAMLKGLEIMFAQLRHSFRFVTVPELLCHGTPYRSYWFKKTTDSRGLGSVETYLQRFG